MKKYNMDKMDKAMLKFEKKREEKGQKITQTKNGIKKIKAL